MKAVLGELHHHFELHNRYSKRFCQSMCRSSFVDRRMAQAIYSRTIGMLSPNDLIKKMEGQSFIGNNTAAILEICMTKAQKYS